MVTRRDRGPEYFAMTSFSNGPCIRGNEYSLHRLPKQSFVQENVLPGNTVENRRRRNMKLIPDVCWNWSNRNFSDSKNRYFLISNTKARINRNSGSKWIILGVCVSNDNL